MAAWSNRILWLSLLGLCLVVGHNSLTRLRHFSPDSMVYVDVARNFNAGRGLGYSTLELNDPELPLERALPVPLTTFPPLYPLAIAGVARLPLGLEAAEAALALAALGWLAVILLGHALARRAWGEPAGRLAAALLLVYAPLHQSGTTAWSETLGLSLLLGSMLALPRAGVAGRGRVALSGLLGGLAFATRYALAPWLVLAPVLVVVALWRTRRQAFARALLWGAAALVPALLVLARNRRIDGTFMPEAGPSTTPFLVNLSAALRTLLGNVVGDGAWAVQAAGVVALLALAVGLAWRCDRSLRALVGDGAPLAWAVGYTVFLVVEGSVREFDAISGRLVLPAGVAAVIFASGAIARGLRVSARLATAALVLALTFVSVREARLWHDLPATTSAQEIAASPRFAWLARHTGPRDLLIGDAMMDVAFHVRRPTISYEDWPGTVPADPARLRAWCVLHRAEYAQAWIVLNDRWPHARDWGRRYGAFFARLATGHDTSDAGVGRAIVLPDAIVYPYAVAATPR